MFLNASSFKLIIFFVAKLRMKNKLFLLYEIKYVSNIFSLETIMSTSNSTIIGCD